MLNLTGKVIDTFITNNLFYNVTYHDIFTILTIAWQSTTNKRHITICTEIVSTVRFQL